MTPDQLALHARWIARTHGHAAAETTLWLFEYDNGKALRKQLQAALNECWNEIKAMDEFELEKMKKRDALAGQVELHKESV